MLFVLACLYSTKLSKILPSGGLLVILAVMMYAIIDTCLFGLITPYYNGWFDRPMWFTALLVSSYFVFVCYFIFKTLFNKQWDKLELYGLIIIIPAIIMAISNSIFSASGILTVLHSSIIGVAGITCMILSVKSVEKRSYFIKLIALLLFFAPFYYSTALHNWEWTYFDVTPKLTTVKIDEGFGKGIN